MALLDQVNEGNALFGAGKIAEALEKYDEVLSKINLATDGERDGADEDQRTVVATVATNRGAALQRLNRNEEALESFSNALKAKPDYIEALHNRGVAYKSMEK